ncbi:MAG TPA: Ig-like domain-containing protein [Candidatus Eisenbacteria bacterium]|nr:Ig-like domain-containing protein [Candidatus Eisenbacteria bacterium]
MAFDIRPASAQTPWTKASPGGGGAFQSVDVSASGKVLVGSDLSGAYVRTGASDWTRIGKADGLTRTSAVCVRWSPATGDSALICGRNSLFISTNAGVTWQAAQGPTATTAYFTAIGWSRSAPSIVYVMGAPGASDTTVVLWRSTNGGFNWSAINHDLPTTEALRPLKLIVHPTDQNTLYLVTGPDGLIAPKVLVPKRALYKSTDGGFSWTLKSGTDAVVDVAVHPTTPSTLLMTVAGVAENTGSLKKSTNGGDSWSPTLDGQGGTFNNTGAVWWDLPKAYLINVGMDACGSIPANAGRFVSNDGGGNWTRDSDGSNWELGWTDCQHARGIPFSGAANALSARGEYWVTSQFVWRYNGTKYENAFTTSAAPGRWITKGIDNAVPVCFADAGSANTVYAGYYDLGLWKSQDDGASWSMINPALPQWNGVGGNVTSVVADSARPGVLWATIAESSKPPYLYRMYRSSNGGASWTSTATGLPYPTFLYGLSMDRQSPIASRRLWVTADGALYTSPDDGATWQASSTAGGLPTTGLFVTEVDRRNSSNVYVGGWNGLWRSTDGGATWSEPAAGFDYAAAPGEIGATNTALHRVKWNGPQQILSDPFVPARVWALSYVKDTTDIPSLHRGVYVSTNSGASWTELRRGKHYRGIAVDSLGRRTIVSTSPASSSGTNDEEINFSQGIETGRTPDGTTWTWSPDLVQADVRYPLGWAVSAGSNNQQWVGVPGYGFMRRTFSGPTAVDDAFAAKMNSSNAFLEVLANDFDPDPGDTLTLVSVNAVGAHGTAKISSGGIDYSPHIGYSGVDYFSYTIRDPSGALSTATVSVRVDNLPLITANLPVAANADDAEESAAGVMNLTSTDLDMTFENTYQTVGMRFSPVAIPHGAQILSAYVQFKVDETSTDPTVLTIHAQASDDAPAFTSGNANLSSRPVSTRSVTWAPASWTTVGAQGPEQRTSDFSKVISEIVHRPGWSAGHAIAVVLTGPGRRVALSRDGDPAGAPILHIEYLGGGTVAVESPPAPRFTLHGVRPTPTLGPLRVEFSLGDAAPATIELIDIAGRHVATRSVGALGAGRHHIAFDERLRAGIYLVRLTQHGQSRTTKAIVLD